MNVKTIRQLVKEYPIFSESSIRNMLHKNMNNIQKVVIRIGRRILIDADLFESWIKEQKDK